MDDVTSGYLGSVLSPEGLAEAVDGLATRLEEAGVEFDAFAFTGVSGLLVGPALAMRMHKGMLVVRKPDDSAHSALRVEGFRRREYDDTGWWTEAPLRYVIVDDFQETGATIRRVRDEVAAHRRKGTCVGIAYYGFAKSWDGEAFVFDEDYDRLGNEPARDYVPQYAWR